ncbi:MAG: HEAT repeat domain-containing protein [Elusimicrobia bacterium]|nr:HEAT repeat domain-containing protein [Elusimicrobiota bacterium]
MTAEAPKPAQAFGVPVPYEATLEELRARLDLPGPPAWAACLALGCKPGPEALDLLARLAKHTEWSLRNLAVQGLGTHPLGAQAAELIVAALADPVQLIVRTACDAAGRLRLAAARPRLTALLASPEPQVRFHAVRALGEVWTPEDHAAVWTLSRKDKAEFVRKEAERTLRRTAAEQTWRRLCDRWKLDAAPRLRVAACELLGEFAQSGDLPELRRLVRDRNAHVRKAAEAAAARHRFF